MVMPRLFDEYTDRARSDTDPPDASRACVAARTIAFRVTVSRIDGLPSAFFRLAALSLAGALLGASALLAEPPGLVPADPLNGVIMMNRLLDVLEGGAA
jgi:hypothetical protein